LNEAVGPGIVGRTPKTGRLPAADKPQAGADGI